MLISVHTQETSRASRSQTCVHPGHGTVSVVSSSSPCASPVSFLPPRPFSLPTSPPPNSLPLPPPPLSSIIFFYLFISQRICSILWRIISLTCFLNFMDLKAESSHFWSISKVTACVLNWRLLSFSIGEKEFDFWKLEWIFYSFLRAQSQILFVVSRVYSQKSVGQWTGRWLSLINCKQNPY